MDNKKFWAIAYNEGWATIKDLRAFVKTESNAKGEITQEEFKEITREDFIKTEKPVEVPAAPPESTTENTVV